MRYTVITGASSGIGKELAYIYAKHGHHLILIARRVNILVELKKELEAMYDVLIECISCDLNELDNVQNIFEKINQTYEINCLINNAGLSYFEYVEDLSLKNIQEQTNVNVISPILGTRILLSNILRNKGSVINICSVLSYLPNLKSSVYTASKYALYGFSNTLRLEYPKLHVLTVHPITVKTNFFKDPSYLSQVKKVIEPKTVAYKTYRYHVKKKRKCDIPRSVSLLNILYHFFPRIFDYLNRRFFSNK
ncbi:SDR family NAD(P)-dependent oxidoreductase [Mycoplasmatota bacterium]|nr:SDR family NAD(P)-dependent oxidoreductase [Mycoplasmatota bacterium]